MDTQGLRRKSMPSEMLEIKTQLARELGNKKLWSVYGDLLQEQGDPRGELIALSYFPKKEVKKRVNAIYKENHKTWHGKIEAACRKAGIQLHILHKKISVVVTPPGKKGELYLSWVFGYIRNITYRPMGEKHIGAPLVELLSEDGLHFLERLIVQENSLRAGLGGELNSHLESGVVFPTLRMLQVNHHKSGRARHSFTKKRYPQLRKLELRAPSQELSISEFTIPTLQSLTLDSNWIGESTLELLANANLPKLENLTLHLKEEQNTEEFILRLFKNKSLAKLQYLQIHGPPNSDQILKRLLKTPFFRQLRKLTLGNNLTDDGAAFLLKNQQRYASLKRMDFYSNNSLSPSTLATLHSRLGSRIKINYSPPYTPMPDREDIPY